MRIATLTCLLALSAVSASAAPRAHVCSVEALLSVDNPIADAYTCLNAVDLHLAQTAAATRVAVGRRLRAADARRILDGLESEAIAGSQSDAFLSCIREISSLHAAIRAEAEEAARARLDTFMRRIGSGMGLHVIP